MSKRPTIDHEILSILNDYHLFIDSEKRIEMPFHVGEIDRNHVSSLKGSAPLLTDNPLGNTVLECEMRERSVYNYTFRILTDAITKRMLFRMDEGDGTHWNRHLPVPVDQQQVVTPHFHVFADDGIMFAYRTPALEELSSPLIINDGFRVFCEEIHINQEDRSLVVQEEGALPFEYVPEDDPLIDIQFP